MFNHTRHATDDGSCNFVSSKLCLEGGESETFAFAISITKKQCA